MAMPIAPTPVLKGQEAVDFLDRMERDQAKPLFAKPTPKLNLAKEKAFAQWGKK